MDLERMLEHRWRIREQGLNILPFRQDQGEVVVPELIIYGFNKVNEVECLSCCYRGSPSLFWHIRSWLSYLLTMICSLLGGAIFIQGTT